MTRYNIIALIVLTIALAACETEEFAACSIGELSGTWRWSYDEVNGDCGPIPDETVTAGSPTPAGCTVYVERLSADRCELEMDFECPLADGQGSQRWVTVMRQIGEERLSGTATVQANHPSLGSCRSTYNIDARKL